MKPQNISVLALATALVSTIFLAPPAVAISRGHSFPAEVLQVLDGDSILVQRESSHHTLRIDLAGIDAKGGSEARKFLNDLAYRKIVNVEVSGTDSGLRARVSLDGKDLGKALVDAGLARETHASAHPVRKLKRWGRLTQIVLGGQGRSAG